MTGRFSDVILVFTSAGLGSLHQKLIQTGLTNWDNSTRVNSNLGQLTHESNQIWTILSRTSQIWDNSTEVNSHEVQFESRKGNDENLRMHTGCALLSSEGLHVT